MILSAPGFVYTDKKIKKTFDYQPVVSSTGLTDTCFVPARARRFQLQMKPGGQRTQYRAGVAVAITGAVTVTPSPVPGLVQISRAFSTWLLSPTCKSQDSPQGTTGKKGRPLTHQVQHVDMPTWSCVCWAPHVLLGRPLNFWHGYPVLQMIEKCSRFKT